MLNLFKLYIVSLVSFLTIDFIWLSVISKNFYQNNIGFLMKESPNLLSAFIFYLLFIIGLIVFVVIPSVEQNSISKAIVLGALFGLVTYSTYDLTNYATIKNWPLIVVVVDIVWGAILSTLVSLVSYYAATKLGL